jgi:hypothetical protein
MFCGRTGPHQGINPLLFTGVLKSIFRNNDNFKAP